MAPKRRGTFTAIRLLLLSASVLVGVAAAAQASPLTLNFSGSLDLTLSGGSADNPFSGFFTWDPATVPAQSFPPNLAIYPLEAHQLILNGIEIDQSLGAGLFVFNDVDAFGTGNVDALMFFAPIKEEPGVGTTAFIGALSGPTTAWNTLALPTDYGFLSLLTTRFSGLSLEVPGGEDGGDANDIRLGGGSFAVTPVPEPATLTLSALGLAGAVARARRRRQRRDQ